MRKTNILLIIALAAAVLASLALNPTGTAAAQEVPPVGVVVAYVPGQSITIVDQSGMQHEYMLSTSLKILPPGRANSLAVGSFVTVIAPASFGTEKQTAVGIVVHPNIPPGWNVPSLSATPVATNTEAGAATATPTGTFVATETATATATATGTLLATETATSTGTPTPTGTVMDTPTPAATATGAGTAVTTSTLIEWLRSLFRQLLTRQ